MLSVAVADTDIALKTVLIAIIDVNLLIMEFVGDC